jgi:hypothetical protein
MMIRQIAGDGLDKRSGGANLGSAALMKVFASDGR